MDRSASRGVSHRINRVSIRGTRSLLWTMFWIALGVVLWPVSAWAAGGAPAIVQPGARMGEARSPEVAAPSIVLGCFSDTDCVEDTVCVREEGSSTEEPGYCVASFDEPDPPVTTPADGDDPRAATVQCGLAFGNGEASGMSIFLAVLALGIARRRRLSARWRSLR